MRHITDKWTVFSKDFTQRFKLFLLWRNATRYLSCIWQKCVPKQCFWWSAGYNNVIIEEGSIISDKCHKLLLNKCEVKSTVCGRMKQRKNTYVCDQIKYRSSLNKIDQFHEILKDKETKHYICKSCHTDIQSQFQCVCCKLHFDTHLCKEFNSTDYDFTNFIVSRCLQSANDEDQN